MTIFISEHDYNIVIISLYHNDILILEDSVPIYSIIFLYQRFFYFNNKQLMFRKCATVAANIFNNYINVKTNHYLIHIFSFKLNIMS